MTRRLPIVATLVVALAVTAMIALGVWQYGKVGAKNALIASYRAADGKPAIAYPELGPVEATALFRRSSATCLDVVGWQVENGRGRDGKGGFRHIAQCSTGAEGPGLLVDMGVSSDPAAKPQWTGGPVEGVIATEPDHNSLVARMFGRAVELRPMLVADTPAPGLAPSARPNPDDIPNNHLSYAFQWFAFAAVALVIYVLALRKRWASEGAAE